jgi:catalase-peroxidase
MNEDSKCPVTGTNKPISGGGTSIRDWWPSLLNLNILHQRSTTLRNSRNSTWRP